MIGNKTDEETDTMDFTHHHPMQRYWSLAVASVQADALDTALQLGLFDALAAPAQADEIAQRLGLHPANTAHLLELLWSMELLLRTTSASTATPSTPRYRLAPVAERYLAKDSPTHCGDAWAYRLRSLRHSGTQMRERVQRGQGPLAQPPAPHLAATGANWASAARVQIGQEQRAVTVQVACELLARVPEFAGARRLLDLGGGPGWVAIGLAQAQAQLEGAVFDWPETAAVARENIEGAGLSHRLSTIGGDLDQDDLGAGYDLVWCSSVLHFVPDVAATLRKIHAALRPGGVLVCAHAEVSTAPREAAAVLPYYLAMRMMGRHVTAEGELALALSHAGFERIESMGAAGFPMAPVQVLVARRAAEDAA